LVIKIFFVYLNRENNKTKAMKSQETQITELLRKIDEFKHISIIHENGRITMDYGYDLLFAEYCLGYNLPEWAEDFPETFVLEGEITIEYAENGSFRMDTKCDVYDCRAMLQEGGDYDGWQLDYQIKTDNIIEYLQEILGEVSHLPEAPQPQEMEILFDDQTHPADAYRNAYVKIGRKNGVLYYSERTNHLRHNEHDYNGRSEWKRMENYEDEHDGRSIVEVYEPWFGKEIEIILNSETTDITPRNDISVWNQAVMDWIDTIE